MLRFIQLCFLYVAPHHALSRIVFWLTRLETPLAHPVMRLFTRAYGVNMQEAESEDFKSFSSFNAFFTRALKPTARVIASEPNVLASPVDGTVSQAGEIHDNRIFQAKGKTYTLEELLGGDDTVCAPFVGGQFATLYLSPRDYHRIHMPLTGTLTSMVYIPGRLFSVAPHTVAAVPKLFARNERVVALFETKAGPVAMVLVGAINVAAIETVWHGLVTPPTLSTVTRYNYSGKRTISLEKGAEMGRFNMGSTVILLTGSNVRLHANVVAQAPVRMGESIAMID